MATTSAEGAKASVPALAVVAALIATLSGTAILTPPFSSPPYVYPGHPYNGTEIEKQPGFRRPENSVGLALPDHDPNQTIDPVYSSAFPRFLMYVQLAFFFSMVALFMASITLAVLSTYLDPGRPGRIILYCQRCEWCRTCLGGQGWWGMLVISISVLLALAYFFVVAAFREVTTILMAGYAELSWLDQDKLKGLYYALWTGFGLFSLSIVVLFLIKCCCATDPEARLRDSRGPPYWIVTGNYQAVHLHAPNAYQVDRDLPNVPPGCFRMVYNHTPTLASMSSPHDNGGQHNLQPGSTTNGVDTTGGPRAAHPTDSPPETETSTAGQSPCTQAHGDYILDLWPTPARSTGHCSDQAGGAEEGSGPTGEAGSSMGQQASQEPASVKPLEIVSGPPAPRGNMRGKRPRGVR